MTAIFWTAFIYLLAVSIPRCLIAVYLLKYKYDPRTAFTAVSVRIGTTVIQIIATIILVITFIIQLSDYEKPPSSIITPKGEKDYKFYNNTGIIIILVVYLVLGLLEGIYNAAMSTVAFLWHKEVKG